MKKFALLSLLAVSALSPACGGTTCDRLNAAHDSFFAGKTTCATASGGTTMSMTKVAACKDVSACNANEAKALDTYASCISKAQPCTDGNESKAVGAGMACLLAVAAEGLSDACAQTLK